MLWLPVPVRILDNETESGSKSTIVLDFCNILLSARSVQIIINERFHGVQVQQMLRDVVIRITEYFARYWLVEVTQIC